MSVISEVGLFQVAAFSCVTLFVSTDLELATAQQKDAESMDEFVLRLNRLSQNCDVVAVNAQAYSDDQGWKYGTARKCGTVSLNFLLQSTVRVFCNGAGTVRWYAV